MNTIFSHIKQCVLLFLMIFIAVASMSKMSIAAQVSPQQIEQFKRLPASQQQALAKSMGIDLNALKARANSAVGLSEETPEKTVVYPRGTQFDAQGNPIENVNVDNSSAVNVNDKKALKPFGYNVFANAPATFVPNLDIAIPEGYIIGKGDVIALQVFGKENFDYQLPVSREGQVIVPNIGAFNVSGLSFNEVKNLLKTKITKSIIGVDAVISLAKLRSIRVFMLGEAYKPGPYTLSSLSTITHALFAAGGISDIGSLRNIQLKRQGKLVKKLDLYELLIKGDSSSDISLQSGDVVFIQQDAQMGILMARNSIAKIEGYTGKYHVKHLDLGTVIKTEK